MAIQGKLSVDAVCYENFSCLYFSGIMNAYRTWASSVYEYASRKTEQPKIFLPGPSVSDQEKVDTAWEVWSVTGNHHFIPRDVYDLLAERKIIELSEEKKEELKTAAKFQLSGTEIGEIKPGLIISTAKKIAVAELFKAHKGAGTKIVL